MWQTPNGEVSNDYVHQLEERAGTHLQRMFELQAKRNFLDYPIRPPVRLSRQPHVWDPRLLGAILDAASATGQLWEYLGTLVNHIGPSQ